MDGWVGRNEREEGEWQMLFKIADEVEKIQRIISSSKGF